MTEIQEWKYDSWFYDNLNKWITIAHNDTVQYSAIKNTLYTV